MSGIIANKGIKLFQTIIARNGWVLLGRWKSGAFKDRISGCIGQTIDSNETIQNASVRITKELTGLQINPDFLKIQALLTFYEEDVKTPSAQVLGDEYKELQLYYDGDKHEKADVKKTNSLDLFKETELFIPKWYHIDKIPYDEMPEDDIHWYPLFLSGKCLTGEFRFQGTQLINHKLHIEKEIKML